MPPQDPQLARWFASEIQPHEGMLRGYLHGLVGPAEVDDIVQETYARLMGAWERGPIESPKGLLFATARNAARDLHRRRITAQTIPIAHIDASRVFDESPGVPDAVCRHQEIDLLTEAIASLPPRCREVLLLRKFESLSHREIAARLGISEHTVDAQLSKALHRCAEFFIRRGAVNPE